MVKHRNDGKEKWQSHNVYIEFEEPYCVGHGATYEDAKEDCIEKIKSQKEAFEKAYNQALQDLSENNIVKVDCLGKPLEHQ